MIIQPGARVEVWAAGVTLECRVSQVQGRMIHLLVSTVSRPGAPPAQGQPVKVILYQSGRQWSTESSAREWVVGKPAVIVIGPIEGWKGVHRRRADRTIEELHATLETEGGLMLYGRTRDFSPHGVSLMLDGPARLEESGLGKLTLRSHDDVWCEGLPVRITHSRKWLRSSGGSSCVGAELHGQTEDQNSRWMECVRRLGLEAER